PDPLPHTVGAREKEGAAVRCGLRSNQPAPTSPPPCGGEVAERSEAGEGVFVVLLVATLRVLLQITAERWGRRSHAEHGNEGNEGMSARPSDYFRGDGTGTVTGGIWSCPGG